LTRIFLVNPRWSFDGSIYFGCRAPHLPIELGGAQALLERDGHEVELVDAHLHDLSLDEISARARAFAPDLAVLTTAPSYLFWRCPPPELRVPRALARALRGALGREVPLVAIGPHTSSTPRAAMQKIDVDAGVLGESEEVLARLARTPRAEWSRIESLALRTTDDGDGASAVCVQGGPAAVDLAALPVLRWTKTDIARHAHHHHRYDVPEAAILAEGPGAEIEWTRGCPYACSFCNKLDFRDRYRKRPLATVLAELDGLIALGARYVYFIDEIFLPDRALLEALRERDVSFGVQLRIDNWSRELLDLLGAAGCKSIEAGVEALTPEGRSLLAKRCRLSTDELTALLIHARRSVPFVQANLIDAGTDTPESVERWRRQLADHGVWANKPVPLFAYPGTPDYRLRWGPPDDRAWERAHADYLARFAEWSDVQDAQPRPLPELEALEAVEALEASEASGG
jgi:B12-binding domain/radical SAM domain protein of rhizo-twelve system